jgi:hypothetical protein
MANELGELTATRRSEHDQDMSDFPIARSRASNIDASENYIHSYLIK